MKERTTKDTKSAKEEGKKKNSKIYLPVIFGLTDYGGGELLFMDDMMQAI
jgi:hypothetical protein